MFTVALFSTKSSLSLTSYHIRDHQLSDRVHGTNYYRFHNETFVVISYRGMAVSTWERVFS